MLCGLTTVVYFIIYLSVLPLNILNKNNNNNKN